jgi:hypothetical protein
MRVRVRAGYKLPPYKTQACEFAFTTQWALEHNVRSPLRDCCSAA